MLWQHSRHSGAGWRVSGLAGSLAPIPQRPDWSRPSSPMFALLAASLVALHPGPKDAQGCHTCTTDCAQFGVTEGQRHCHRIDTPATPPRTPPKTEPEPDTKKLQKPKPRPKKPKSSRGTRRPAKPRTSKPPVPEPRVHPVATQEASDPGAVPPVCQVWAQRRKDPQPPADCIRALEFTVVLESIEEQPVLETVQVLYGPEKLDDLIELDLDGPFRVEWDEGEVRVTKPDGSQVLLGPADSGRDLLDWPAGRYGFTPSVASRRFTVTELGGFLGYQRLGNYRVQLQNPFEFELSVQAMNAQLELSEGQVALPPRSRGQLLRYSESIMPAGSPRLFSEFMSPAELTAAVQRAEVQHAQSYPGRVVAQSEWARARIEQLRAQARAEQLAQEQVDQAAGETARQAAQSGPSPQPPPPQVPREEAHVRQQRARSARLAARGRKLVIAGQHTLAWAGALPTLVAVGTLIGWSVLDPAGIHRGARATALQRRRALRGVSYGFGSVGIAGVIVGGSMWIAGGVAKARAKQKPKVELSVTPTGVWAWGQF